MTPTRARSLAHLSLALAATAAFALPAFVGPAHAQDVIQADRCRAQLSKANRRYVDRVLRARLKCQNKMMDGKLSLATDCLFGDGDDTLARQLRKYEARLSNTGKACNGVNLQILGFPGVCTDNTGFPFDTSDFQECVIDQTDDTLDALLDVYFPPITKYYRDNEYLCLAGAPQDGAKSLARKMSAREKCLVGQDYGLVDSDVNCRAEILPFGGGTGDRRTDDSVGRAYDTLLGGVPPACADIQIDDLDYQSDCEDETGGVFTVLDLKRCFFDANRNAALAVLRIVFPEAGVCGDGVKNGDEECDDGLAGNSDTTPNACRTDCTNPSCHDGVVDNQFGEQCDDGNLNNTDCCVDECRTATCGDGYVGCGEQCDQGPNNANAPDTCRASGPHACQNPKCGDGIEDTGEECDDGNLVDSDGCSSLCFDEFCGDEIVQSAPPLSEECDEGVDNSDEAPDACRTNCKNASCGDGVVDTGEVCDDGNTIDGDGCDSTCAICGDGDKAPTEECDIDPSICGPGEGCNASCKCEPACPSEGELTLYAGYGNECVNNADCPVGECGTSGRCETVTRLDSGWTGLAHDADINNDVRTRGFLQCNGRGPVCGECNVVGVDPSLGTCRCSNNTRTICDEPFVADNDDCGGNICDCYFGSPFPLSSGGTPACVVNRFARQITGTANVDLGEGSITANLKTRVYLGISTRSPCLVCGGTCSNAPGTLCTADEDCTGGTCNLDPVPDDGIRGGVCVGDSSASDNGQPCDVTGTNAHFPAYVGAPGGGGYSLDCLPAIGKNISGTGLTINLTQTTGQVSLPSQISCTGPGAGLNCPCLMCSSDPTVPCNSDQDCAALGGSCTLSAQTSCLSNADCTSANVGPCTTSIGRCSKATSVTCTSDAQCLNANVGNCNPSTCSAKGPGSQGTFPLPNSCEDQLCTDLGGGVGECTTGPDTKYCAGVVKANGRGILSCNDDAGCAPGAVGVDARPCALIERAGCFLDPIVGSGVPDPSKPIGTAVFCVGPTSNSGINDVAGLPGPGRVTNQATAKTFCSNDTSKQYQPGVGGCIETSTPLPKSVVEPAAGPAGKGSSSSHGR